MKNKEIIFMLIILLLFSPLSFAQDQRVVETAKSVRDDISLNELITGSLIPVQDANIPAQIGGVAAEVNVEIGEEVKKDSQLVKIDAETLEIKKRQTKAALDSAQANYNELKNGVTAEEMAKIKANYQNAKAGLESAKTNLKLMEELYNERRSLEQQLVNAEQQLENAKQSHEQAKINYKQAKKDYERAQNLYADDVISEKDFDNAENSYENAEISLSQAKTSLSVAKRSYQLTKETYNNPTELKQQLENAKSQVNSAQANFEVASENLKEAKRGARSEKIRASLASVEQAKANLAELEDQIAKTKITAPFSGLINQVNVDQHEMIAAGQTVINLINLDQLYAEIKVTATTAAAIEKGEQVEVKPEIMQHYIKGEITNIAPAADPESRTFLVKIKISNPDHRLKSGMFADVKITKGKSGSAVVVPIESIVGLNSENPYLFVIEAGKAVKKELEIGIMTDSRVEILSGLKADQDIIIRGQNNLEAGQAVEVRSR